MAIIRVKRAATFTNPTLQSGELGLIGNDLYFGRYENGNVGSSPTKLANQNANNDFIGVNNFLPASTSQQNVQFYNYSVAPVPAVVSYIKNGRIYTIDPTEAQEVATKNYVDGKVQGLDIKNSVKAATTGNITLAGYQIIDTVELTTGGIRVLVKDQTDKTTNGIYLTNSSTWTRAADAIDITSLISAFVFVEEGDANVDTGWVCISNLGDTNIIWSQFSGAGSFKAGYGLKINATDATKFEIDLDKTMDLENAQSVTGIKTFANQTLVATSPSFTTPSLGAATATSINGVIITAANDEATLTIANHKALIANVGLTVGASTTYTGAVTVRSGGSSATIIEGPSNGTAVLTDGTMVSRVGTQTLTNKTITGLALTAGTTTVAPLTFAAGTNLTTATAGKMEFDGNRFYLTPSTTRYSIPLAPSGTTLTFDTAPVAGGIAYGSSASNIKTTAAGTAGQVVLSGGTGTPTFTTGTLTLNKNLTVNNTYNITLEAAGADRTLKISGANKELAGAGTVLTIDNSLDLAGTTGQITLGSSTYTLAFTTTANTAVTLPTTGTLATVAGVETFTNKTLTSPDINGGTADSLTSLSVRDTSAVYDITIKATSSTVLTASRTLTLDLANSNKTLKLAANLTVGGTGAVTLQSVGSSATTIKGPNNGTATLQDGTMAITGGTLGQFASTTSAQLAGVISDVTGYDSGALLVFSKNPTFEGITLSSGVVTGHLAGGVANPEDGYGYVYTSVGGGAAAAWTALEDFAIDGGDWTA